MFLAHSYQELIQKVCFLDIAILSFGAHFSEKLTHFRLIFPQILKIYRILMFFIVYYLELHEKHHRTSLKALLGENIHNFGSFWAHFHMGKY